MTLIQCGYGVLGSSFSPDKIIPTKYVLLVAEDGSLSEVVIET